MWVLTPKGDLINLDWFHTLRVDELTGGKQVIRAFTVHGGSEKPIATYEAEKKGDQGERILKAIAEGLEQGKTLLRLP